MAVEKILVPVRTVGRVSDLGVDAHNRGKHLSKEEYAEAGEKGRIYLCRAGCGFSLSKLISTTSIY